jgi:hypothetical protein
VQTEAGVEGWIYQTLVHVEEQDEVPTAPRQRPYSPASSMMT